MVKARHVVAAISACSIGMILEGCGGGSPSPSPASPTPVPSPHHVPTPVPMPPSPTPGPTKPTLPADFIAVYTNGADVQDIEAAAGNWKPKANAIIWSNFSFANNMLREDGFTANDVRTVWQGLEALQKNNVLHFLRVGGFGSDHTISKCEGSCSAETYASQFRLWNAGMKKQIPKFPGFAGIDWSYQSNSDRKWDDMTTILMLNVSRLLSDEFLILMSPPQSYFDCTDGTFDKGMRIPAPTNPSWRHHGHNLYAGMYAKCPECFDLVIVNIAERNSKTGLQLYWDGNASNVNKEGYPKNATQHSMEQTLQKNIKCLMSGWNVDFKGFLGLQNETVAVPREKLAIGLKLEKDVLSHNYVYIPGDYASEVYCGLSQRPRGYTLWACELDQDQKFVTELSEGIAACSGTHAQVTV